MGAEAVCNVRYAGQICEGKALLETSELLFRSPEFRLRIPFRDITSLADSDGELTVSFGAENAVFELGNNAAKWAEKIRNPRGLMDKLSPGASVAVLGDGCLIPEQPLAKRTRCGMASGSRPPSRGRRMDDRRPAELVPALAQGAARVVSPKAKARRSKTQSLARGGGRVGGYQGRFSETIRRSLVIPASRR
jgi:hypothetical protein